MKTLTGLKTELESMMLCPKYEAPATIDFVNEVCKLIKGDNDFRLNRHPTGCGVGGIMLYQNLLLLERIEALEAKQANTTVIKTDLA